MYNYHTTLCCHTKHSERPNNTCLKYTLRVDVSITYQHGRMRTCSIGWAWYRPLYTHATKPLGGAYTDKNDTVQDSHQKRRLVALDYPHTLLYQHLLLPQGMVVIHHLDTKLSSIDLELAWLLSHLQFIFLGWKCPLMLREWGCFQLQKQHPWWFKWILQMRRMKEIEVRRTK